MNKTLNKILSLVLMLFLVTAVFQFFTAADRPENINTLTRGHPIQMTKDPDDASRIISGFNLTAGMCALLLMGYLFWFLVRKFQRDSQAELNARENSLYRLSLATGRSEYDLFHKSAEGWSISHDRIEQDFKRYMIHQVLPHYAQDFVRKNQTYLDRSLIVKKKVKPTAWTDWAIALLVFPGSIFFLFIIIALYDKA